jgi:fucose permease
MDIEKEKTMKSTYKSTMYACFVGYIVQAIVNNFIPLLFLTFQSAYGIPITKITFLVTFNFGVQLIVDFISPPIIDKAGYRISIIIAHVMTVLGFLALVILPDLCSDPFTGLMTAVIIYAIGGGLLEVLVSPIVEACPSDNKEAAMSLLHSFYCWGHVAVVLLSTIFFSLVGIHHWKILALLWAVIPFANAVFFAKVPIGSLLEDGETGLMVKELAVSKTFWLMVVLMVCAGASEQAVSQWASAFAEMGLGVSKTIGDLAGPMFFAIMMGTSRAIYGNFGNKVSLQKVLLGSGILCVASYLIIVFTTLPAMGLIGCGICGFSVGVLWPGTFSMSSAKLRGGGTAMFAYLALAGDLGCSIGPTTVGNVYGLSGRSLKTGILVAIIYPVLFALFCVILYKKDRKPKVSKK